MYKIELTPQALEDLKNIKFYIENEKENPIAAQNTILKIIQEYENLADMPEIGIPVQRYVSFPTDYKFILANNYSIFYRIENNNIKIIRIIYSKRDFIKILFS